METITYAGRRYDATHLGHAMKMAGLDELREQLAGEGETEQGFFDLLCEEVEEDDILTILSHLSSAGE